MNLRPVRLPAVAALCLLLATVACDLGGPVGPGGGGGPAPTIGNLRFTIRHVVFDPQSGTTPLRLDGTQYRTAYGNTYDVSRLRYYVSEVGVQYEDLRYVSAQPHLVDTDDPSTMQFYVDNVPADHYHDVVLTIGLDAAANVDGALPGAENDDMAWPAALGGGYYYMKVEGEVQGSGGTTQPFLTGTGRIERGAVSSPHFVNVNLTSHFNVIPGRVVDVELILDVNRWYGGPNVIDLEAVAGGIESNEAVQTDMARNGAYVFTLGAITTL